MAKATANIIVPPKPPKPDSVTLELNWEEFLVLHALVGLVQPAKTATLVDEARSFTTSNRPKADLTLIGLNVVDDAMGRLYEAVRPIFNGTEK